MISSMASQITGVTLYTQPFVQAQIKENNKAPRHWPLCRNSPVTGEFPAQKASSAENAYIWWRHHEVVDLLTSMGKLMTVTINERCVISSTHWGRDKTAVIMQTTYSNGFSGTKILQFRLNIHWNLFLGGPTNKWPSSGDKQLSEPMMA